MEKSLPLNDCEAKKTHTVINRLHSFTHGAALVALIYYRITTFASLPKTTTILPHILIFIAELILSFIWLLAQAANWNPVARTAYPDRLLGDENLPSIDVFICTADPIKEPSLDVMNTVISAMALDYPPNKLHLYLSDDGGSPVTLRALKHASDFSKLWIPFCRKYMVKNRCPKAYFFGDEVNDKGEVDWSDEFVAERKEIEKAYEDFKCCLGKIFAETDVRVSRDHPPIVEVINGESSYDQELPLVVYIAREKRPSQPHNFKAGALNVLYRVSAMISNSPYILTLDCDMYCSDPTSARQAMCFHLDPNLSPKLGFVQFPQIFHNIGCNDIYDGAMRFIWPTYEGLNGLRGPVMSGTGFYMKREAIYGTRKFQQDVDLNQLKKCFGSSNEFIKSIYRNYKPYNPNNRMLADNEVQKELQLLASCSYDNGTKWGKEADALNRFSERLSMELQRTKGAMLNKIDMFFFPIYYCVRFYVICINMKKKQIEIIDSSTDKEDEPIEVKYGYVPSSLRDVFADFLLMNNMKVKSACVRTSPFYEVPVSWRVRHTKEDCGIYVMRHMETYMGECGANWDAGFKKRSTKQMRYLRVKYLKCILCSRINLLAERNKENAHDHYRMSCDDRKISVEKLLMEHDARNHY